MNKDDHDVSGEVYLPPEGLKDKETIEYLAEERGTAPNNFYNEPDNFTEWKEREIQKQVFLLLYRLQHSDVRTPSLPEYTFCRDRFNQGLNPYILRDYIANKENIYDALSEFCKDGPEKLKAYLQVRQETTSSTYKKGNERIKSVSDPDKLAKKKIILNGILPWINDIAGSLPVIPSYSEREREKMKNDSVVQIAEIFGIKMQEDSQNGGLLIETPLDIQSLEYLAFRLQERNTPFKDLFVENPLSQEGITQSLLTDNSILQIIESRIVNNPKVEVFHNLCTMLDFLGYPFLNETDQKRMRYEEEILLDIFGAINNRVQETNVKAINSRVLDYIKVHIEPLYQQRSQQKVIPKIDQNALRSDLPLDLINEVFTKRLPNGIDGNTIIVIYERVPQVTLPGIKAEVGRYSPKVIFLFGELKHLPYIKIEEANFMALREMSGREIEEQRKDLRRVLLHELLHIWLWQVVSDYYSSPSTMSPKSLLDIQDDTEQFLLDCFLENNEFKGNDIFSLSIDNMSISDYDPDKLKLLEDRTYAHEIFAEICCQADIPERFLVIRRELPWHYFMYRVLYEIRDNKSIPYERFINAMHEYLNTDRDARVVKKFIEFARKYT